MRYACCCFRLLILSTFCLQQSPCVQAQEVNLDSAMLAESKTITETAHAGPAEIRAFRATRTSNGHSVETLPKGVLDIKVQHRFGYLSGGWENFFGLDDATIRIGGDFGITDRLMIGGGRATYEKQWDGFLKYKILQQQNGARKMPLSMSVMFSTMLQTMPTPDDIDKLEMTDRLFYAGQILLARKFGKVFTLQLMPTFVHYNMVPLESDPNDIFSLGIATAIRITHRADIVVEYYYNIPSTKFDGTQNYLSVGVDLETAGHVFQIMFTNASGIAERPFITESTGKFFEGDIRIGFNVSRSFQLIKPKKPKTIG